MSLKKFMWWFKINPAIPRIFHFRFHGDFKTSGWLKEKKKKDVSPNSDTTSQKFTMETTVSIKLLQRPLKV